MENMTIDYQGFKRDTDLAVEKIRTGAMTMVQGAVELGYQLKVARDTGVLQESGYSSMGEFARAEYGLRPDQTTRYMQLNDKYSEDGYSRRLKEKYTGIGKTILMEMLTLPDIISDEITENFSKEDVRALSAELKEENEVTDLEVMMEETDQVQEKLPSILEQTAYQLGKDQPQIYIDLFEALYINESQAAAEILAPDEEKIYSLRIPGTGRILLSLKLSEQQVRLINVRSQEKEDFTWQQLEAAFRKLMDFTNGPEESWKEQYGEEFPREEPQEIKSDKKQPKVQKAKKPERKKPEKTKPVGKVENSVDKSQKTAVEQKEEQDGENTSSITPLEEPKIETKNEEKSQETALSETEPQIPGQDNIINHPEYMPKPEKEPEKEPVTEIAEEKPEEHAAETDNKIPEHDVRPDPEIAPAQPESEETAAEPMTRKGYIDTLTAYGTAEYIARAMRTFSNKTYNTLLDKDFWNEWLTGKVDHNGRPWEE